MSGKLKGIPALNTSPLANQFCMKMAKTPGIICEHCYSVAAMLGARKNANPRFVKNYEALQKPVPPEFMPWPSGPYIRINGHGELGSVVHLENLLNWAEFHPLSRFVLWTKRKDLVNLVLAKREKPNNFVLIYSNPKLDKPMREVPKHFDKVFQNVTEDSDEVNCFSACGGCMLCYDKQHEGVQFITEKVKNRGTKRLIKKLLTE